MNRSVPIDSKLLLDVGAAIAESAAMVRNHCYVYAERRDTARNMARFYALSLEPTLFGEVCLVRRWGRIGSYGQTKAMFFTDIDAAAAQLARIQRQKARRGYRERLAKSSSL